MNCFFSQIREEPLLGPDQPFGPEGRGGAAQSGAKRGHPDGAAGAALLAQAEQGHLRQGGRQDTVDKAQERAHTLVPR